MSHAACGGHACGPELVVVCEAAGVALSEAERDLWLPRAQRSRCAAARHAGHWPKTVGGDTAVLGRELSEDPDFVARFEREGRIQASLCESTSAEDLENPDNLVVVPATGDVFLQEDSDGEQFVRGVTRRGKIYDLAQTLVNDSEFCSGCNSPGGDTFYLTGRAGGWAPARTPARSRCTAVSSTRAADANRGYVVRAQLPLIRR